MPSSLDLTGTWSGSDGALYYVRQVGSAVWWAGLSTDTHLGIDDFQLGVRFSNVFHGQLSENTLRGDWADVPRGAILNHGTLTIIIASDSAMQRQAQTGGFGCYFWTKTALPALATIRTRFDRVIRNDGDTMHDHLKMYRDNVVVFGTVAEELTVNFPHSQPRGYSSFMCPQWWPGIFGDPPDGDVNFRIVLDRADLDSQPHFWDREVDWFNDPKHIQRKLDNDRSGQLHCEVIMYGRPAGRDNCSGNVPALLPGWMERGPVSVLWNGTPIDGLFSIDAGQPDSAPSFRPHRIGFGGVPLSLRSRRVRVTGFFALDCHGGDCEEDDVSVHNAECHPVYGIDLLRDAAVRPPHLNGAWHCDDVGTYYIRQIGSAVWWLGLSRDRGYTFANVFRGTLEEGAINGEWTDVPLGFISNSGTISLATDGSGPQATVLTRSAATGGFGGSRWEKLYDRLYSDDHPAPPVG